MIRNVVPGLWYAGLNLPWLATPGMVADKLRGLGLTQIKVHKRKEPIPVNPKIDTGYKDDWDTWVEAVYSGPPKSVDLGNYARWLVGGTPDQHIEATSTPVGPPTASMPSLKTVVPVPAIAIGLVLAMMAYNAD